jgi:hypothetical protein
MSDQRINATLRLRFTPKRSISPPMTDGNAA